MPSVSAVCIVTQISIHAGNLRQCRLLSSPLTPFSVPFLLPFYSVVLTVSSLPSPHPLRVSGLCLVLLWASSVRGEWGEEEERGGRW